MPTSVTIGATRWIVSVSFTLRLLDIDDPVGVASVPCDCERLLNGGDIRLVWLAGGDISTPYAPYEAGSVGTEYDRVGWDCTLAVTCAASTGSVGRRTGGYSGLAGT
jgi:hypothetical protein